MTAMDGAVDAPARSAADLEQKAKKLGLWLLDVADRVRRGRP